MCKVELGEDLILLLCFLFKLKFGCGGKLGGLGGYCGLGGLGGNDCLLCWDGFKLCGLCSF